MVLYHVWCIRGLLLSYACWSKLWQGCLLCLLFWCGVCVCRGGSLLSGFGGVCCARVRGFLVRRGSYVWHGSLAFGVLSFFFVGISLYTKQHLFVIKIFEEMPDGCGVRLCQGMEFLREVFMEALDAILIHFVESTALLPSVLDICAQYL